MFTAMIHKDNVAGSKQQLSEIVQLINLDNERPNDSITETSDIQEA